MPFPLTDPAATRTPPLPALVPCISRPSTTSSRDTSRAHIITSTFNRLHTPPSLWRVSTAPRQNFYCCSPCPLPSAPHGEASIESKSTDETLCVQRRSRHWSLTMGECAPASRRSLPPSARYCWPRRHTPNTFTRAATASRRRWKSSDTGQ